MLYTITGQIRATTAGDLLQIPLKSSSKLISIQFFSFAGASFVFSFSDQNKLVDLSVSYPTTNAYRIYDDPNTAVFTFNNDTDSAKELFYDLSMHNIIIEDTLNFQAICNGTVDVVFNIIAEYTEQPIDAKNTLVRDLAEAVVQVADGENLISAGEVFFQKRIRGLKQVGQGEFER